MNSKAGAGRPAWAALALAAMLAFAPPAPAQYVPPGYADRVAACSIETAMDDETRAALRRALVRSDRMTTSATERRIADFANRQDACLAALHKQMGEHPDWSRGTTPAAIAADLARRRKSASADVRAVMVSLGYRPSRAAPAPMYFYCIIHNDYSPPQYKDYQDDYFMSGLVRDTAPDDMATGDFTRQQAALMARFRQWIAVKYIPPSYQDDLGCQSFDTIKEGEAAMADEIEDGKVKTGVQ